MNTKRDKVQEWKPLPSYISWTRQVNNQQCIAMVKREK